MGTKVSIQATIPFFRAGSLAELEITVDAEGPIHVAEVSARFMIWEGLTNRPEEMWTMIDELRVVVDRGVLPAGVTRYPVSFRVPATSPPTHDSSPGFVHATATAAVWQRRPYLRWDATCAVAVRMSDAGPVARCPVTRRSDDGGLTVELASSRVTIGEAVAGWLRCSSTPAQDVTLIIELVAKTRVPDERTGEEPLARRRCRLPASAHGKMVPFAFAMPAAGPPSFESVSHTRAWELVVKGPGETLHVPLEIIDGTIPAAGSSPDAALHHLPPDLRQLLDAGWTLASAPVPVSTRGVLWPSVQRDEGDAQIVMGIAHDEEDRREVYARVSTSSTKALGLRVTPSSRWRELLSSDIEAGIPSWDRRYRVTASDREGARAYLAARAPAVLAMTALPDLVEWTDTHAAFARALESHDGVDWMALGSDLVRFARTERPEPPASGPYR